MSIVWAISSAIAIILAVDGGSAHPGLYFGFAAYFALSSIAEIGKKP